MSKYINYIALVKGDLVCNIPDGMTNGEVIKALFPKAKVFENENNVKYPYVDVLLYSENHMNCYEKDWWNAPYNKGEEE